MTVAIDPAQSSGRKLGITRGVTEPVLRWLAEIVAAVIQPFRYFFATDVSCVIRYHS